MSRSEPSRGGGRKALGREQHVQNPRGQSICGLVRKLVWTIENLSGEQWGKGRLDQSGVWSSKGLWTLSEEQLGTIEVT